MSSHQTVITVDTEQTSDFPRDMVMINRESFGKSGMVSKADCTAFALTPKEFLVLVTRDAILPPDVSFPGFRHPVTSGTSGTRTTFVKNLGPFEYKKVRTSGQHSRLNGQYEHSVPSFLLPDLPSSSSG